MLTIILHWLALVGIVIGLLLLGYTVGEVIWTWRNDPATAAHFARVRLVPKLIVIGVLLLGLSLITITIGVYR